MFAFLDFLAALAENANLPTRRHFRVPSAHVGCCALEVMYPRVAIYRVPPVPCPGWVLRTRSYLSVAIHRDPLPAQVGSCFLGFT